MTGIFIFTLGSRQLCTLFFIPASRERLLNAGAPIAAPASAGPASARGERPKPQKAKRAKLGIFGPTADRPRRLNIYNKRNIGEARFRPETPGNAGNSGNFLFTRGVKKSIYKLMPATLNRDQMRLYQRERRARLKAEIEASEPIVDAAIPRNALLKESREDLSRMWAKVSAIGPGAVITKTNGRLDVLRREEIEARDKASPPSHHAVTLYEPPKPSRSVAPPMPAPRSMIAVGGRPADRSGFASVATETAAFRANVTASLNRLAQEAVAARRESEAQERRIAALEAAASRNVAAAGVVQAIADLFSHAIRRSA
jgi:hypothetical protein